MTDYEEQMECEQIEPTAEEWAELEAFGTKPEDVFWADVGEY